MGYPMTFRRFVNRNGLAEGTYDYERQREFRVAPESEGRLEVWRTLARSAYDDLNARINRHNMLLGDLRRLEKDSVDEAATCRYIADRTGIEPDVVAAVLKEFIAW